ncbi:hypothetical protein KIN20_021175 [Parelaphostrongylus tenuis]|uniref:Uncharacterized protein n=1 Tax=Parelaphostrongylus tenuis TaxID=148309 RepID=A0AAD5QU04_PARTN|nr:hypothetical protein KIN20_021175 [Parelaphostrongylus tenuis]
MSYQAKKPELFTIFVGSTCTNPELCWESRPQYSVVEVTVHDKYKPCEDMNDLAILEVSPDITNMHGSPICMPKPVGEPFVDLMTGVGFGIDSM